MEQPPASALSILIATRNRAESLRRTLALLGASRTSETWEVVVIDNGSAPPLTQADVEAAGVPRLRLLHEGRPGKGHALNRALAEGGLGEIVAVLDDDMSPDPAWVAGVIGSARRLPQYAIFAGRSKAEWAEGMDVPAWARDASIHGWAFSVLDAGEGRDLELGTGRSIAFPSGNCFWFRRAALTPQSRFPPVWMTEPEFVLTLRAAGHRGVFVPEAVCGHRVQQDLLDPAVLRRRAALVGRSFALVDLAYPEVIEFGAEFRRRPWRCRLHWLAALGVWAVRWLGSWFLGTTRGFPRRLRAVWGLSTNAEKLRLSFARHRIARTPIAPL